MITKAKKIFLVRAICIAVLISGLGILNGYSQNLNWIWAHSAGSISSESTNSIATDMSGNVFTVGYFASYTITFGAFTLTNASSGGGVFDIFIVKYDGQGNVLWAKSAGGNSSDYAYSIAVDPLGNIIVVGYFSSLSITFGSKTIINAGNSGVSDMFVRHYTESLSS